MVRLAAVVVVVVLGAALSSAMPLLANASMARTPVASAAATKCSFKGLEQEHMGPSYVTSLAVSGVNCNFGKALVRAYYRCRVRSGGVRGYCHSPVYGFRCGERRSGIKIQFDARVTCVRGARRVTHTYTQNT